MNSQIHIFADSAQVDTICDLLTLCGALAITLQDAAYEDLYEIDLGKIMLWNQTKITALFDETIDIDQVKSLIKESIVSKIEIRFVIEELEAKAWEREWLKNFRPMRFGERLWICPHGQHPSDTHSDDVIVYLDPGLAFGTGTHPTTKLCLEWLDEFDLQGKTVVDYGCGSGILSLAALKLGAETVWAVDHDPQALIATQENANKNQIESQRLHVILPEDVSLGLKADVIMANILAKPLIDLADIFPAILKSDGHLVLSGILETQLPTLLEVYSQRFDNFITQVNDGWVRIEMKLKKIEFKI